MPPPFQRPPLNCECCRGGAGAKFCSLSEMFLKACVDSVCMEARLVVLRSVLAAMAAASTFALFASAVVIIVAISVIPPIPPGAPVPPPARVELGVMARAVEAGAVGAATVGAVAVGAKVVCAGAPWGGARPQLLLRTAIRDWFAVTRASSLRSRASMGEPSLMMAAMTLPLTLVVEVLAARARRAARGHVCAPL